VAVLRRGLRRDEGRVPFSAGNHLEDAGDAVFADGAIRKIKAIGPRAFIATIPRYEAFTAHALALLADGVLVLDIACNDEILLTALVPAEWILGRSGGVLVLSEALLTDPTTKRVAIKAPVRALHAVVGDLQQWAESRALL
jgi:hypothetical protein